MATPLSTLDAWILIAILSVAAFLPRASFILIAPNLALPGVRRKRHVPELHVRRPLRNKVTIGTHHCKLAS